MSWLYEQDTGRLFTPGGRVLAIGYSGQGNGKNNPALEAVHNLGPLPLGQYTMLPALDSPELGPQAIPLLPKPGTQTHGRTGLFIHGELPDHLQDSSHGCLCAPRFARDRMASSVDRVFIVTRAMTDPLA